VDYTVGAKYLQTVFRIFCPQGQPFSSHLFLAAYSQNMATATILPKDVSKIGADRVVKLFGRWDTQELACFSLNESRG
jgi:hypothetical protein